MGEIALFMSALYARARIFFLLGFLACPFPVLSQTCTPRALAIGVSVYEDTSFIPLRHAKDDAVAFSAWFRSNARCASGNGAQPVVKTLLDAQATRASIMNEFSRVLETAGRDDEVFIFISARGIKTPDYGEGYLLGYDSRRGKLHPSGIEVQNFQDVLPARRAAHVFFFADISRELPVPESPARNQIVSYLQTKMQVMPTLSAVLSAKPGQVSNESDVFMQGLFTHFLLEELKPGRRNLDNVFQSLRAKVLNASKPTQEPVKFGDANAIVELTAGEQILLAALGPPQPGLLAPQQPAQPPPLPGPLDLALDEAARLEQDAQTVLLRYGEGNQFPDDPLRPGALDFDRAGDLFEKALITRPTLSQTDLDGRLRRSLTARMLFCRGRALAYQREYDDARKVLEQARDTDPLLPEPYNAIGVTFLEQGQYAQAIDSFRKSIDVARDWAYPRHNLALTYIEMGDNRSAVDTYREAIQRTPQLPYLYYNLGVLFQRINRRSEAQEYYRAAIQKFEDQIRAHRQRAASLAAENPEAKADEDVANQEAGTTVRNEGEAYNALGVLRRKGDKARQSYKKALNLNPELYAAQYNLGVLELQEHGYSDAVTALESAVKNLPEAQDAQAQLDCARKGLEYNQSLDKNTKGRLRKELKVCLSR